VNLKPWESAPERYAELLDAKATQVEARLAALGAPPATRIPSPSLAYRARAEFRLWHDGDDLYYVMYDPQQPRDPVRVDRFPVALTPIQDAMSALRDRLRDDSVLRRKLFQVEFMASRDGETLVTLAYHRPLDDEWETRAQGLAADLSLSIVGRSRGRKRVIGRDHIVERVRINGETYALRQYEQAFAQPNAYVNEAMLNWAVGEVAASTADLLELYCGNGNFTLPLARRFRSVLATELSKSGTRAAIENLRDNAVTNVAVVRLSAEEVSAALAGERAFRRLAHLPRPLDDYRFHTVFVDPPRAGLDDATLTCVQQFAEILYVSCNPKTLEENLRVLRETHEIESLACFDQFPYTPHLECAVRLARRPAPRAR
jgi:tRNA (uracil-5-)-methyltransferase